MAAGGASGTGRVEAVCEPRQWIYEQPHRLYVAAMSNQTSSGKRFVVVASQLLLVVAATAAQDAPAPQAVIQAALEAPVVSSEVVLEEVRRFAERRVPDVPQAASPQEWEKLAGRLRRETLEKVVLRGEAARWAAAPCGVEWLDTIEGGPGYKLRKLRFEALPGLWVPALLYLPDKVDGRVPVVLNVNGHDPKGKAVDYKQIRCINQARRGMIALNVEWFGMGQLRSDGFYHYRANQLDLCGTSAVAPFYLSMKRSLDLLLALPQADPQRVAVAGLSGGGWQTIFISSLDERVTLANPVAGYSSFKTRARYPSDLGDTEQTPTDLATVVDYAHLTAMRAPRPTLLTYNSKDNCCFAAGHALEPLLKAAGPIFALYGQQANLRSHINDDPGTHNFEQDNREQLYRMLGDHFYAGQAFDWHEIACKDEVKTAEQLEVPLPSPNEDFNTLARKLAGSLPRPGGASADELRRIVRLPSYEVAVELQAAREDAGVSSRPLKLRLGDDWTVPAVEIRKGSPTGTAVLIADKGRKSTAEHASRLVSQGLRVIAVDPFYFGESAISSRDNLHAMLVAGVGERPLGIQAGQVASVARWAAREGSPVALVAVGPRTSTIALIAAAVEKEAIGSVQVNEPLKSLKLLIEESRTVQQTPELFCFGLLEHFDIKEIAALIAPRPVQGL